jgi:hypothetical protein
MPDPTNHVPFILPSAADQFSAALSAPIPFFIAMVVVAVALASAIWKAFSWRYDGIIEMTQERVVLAQAEAKSAKEKQTELEKTVKSLKDGIANLAPKSSMMDFGTSDSPEVKKTKEELSKKIEELSKIADTADSQLFQLGSSNNAVTDLLSHIPTSGYRVTGPSN